MKIVCMKTKKGLKELFKEAEGKKIVFLNPEKIKSEEEILLAEQLTEEAFRKKQNISKEFSMEFLLWIAGTTRFSKAKEYSAKGKEILAIYFDKKEKNNMKKKSGWKAIERISLARIME
ncbi:hypothetical protein KAW38_01885 [Candidatus Micrarchaeota archaeon]|nr:hypothetical protein [Candidatus Micrarchaeota archaeon]